jgi:choline dehydrogenase-like flavoprotein
MLSYLRPDPSVPVAIQDTEFTKDLLGRFVCSTFDEAVHSGGRPFDVVVIGAGMFGAYLAEKIYRQSVDEGLRILVLDAGSFLLPTHSQNLPHLGLNAPGAVLVTRNDQDPGPRVGVWGVPWHSNEPFTGLAYCPAGRSIFWGGWSPRHTAVDLASWPKDARDFLNTNYATVEREIGVQDKADYMSGPLNTRLQSSLQSVAAGAALSSDITIDTVEDAPLAVQASSPGPGLFSFDKYSSAPILLEAIRDDIARQWTLNDDSRRRLFLVPRAHVIRLQQSGSSIVGLELTYEGQRRFLSAPANLSPTCQLILAAGTIESTRLALESFPLPRRDYAIGANFMAHLRTNLTVRVKRSALGLAASTTLEQGGAIVRGEIATPGGKRRYHYQVLASAEKGQNPEATMWTMVPDIDLLDKLLVNESPDWVSIVLRGIGEMDGDTRSGPGSVTSFVNLTNAGDTAQLDEAQARRAWVNFVATSNDYAAWRTMAQAAVTLAQRLGKNPGDVEYLSGNTWSTVPPADPFTMTKDQLGTTHHEAGTLWMGDDPAKSITDTTGRFHHVANAYAVGPSLFPTVGSANPSLTGLTLARRTAATVLAAVTPKPSTTFKPLYTGSLADWQMAGFGGFLQVFDILESTDGPGLLWYTREAFSDFVLALEWQYANRTDNSGVFIRVPAMNSADPQNDWQVAINGAYEIQIDPRGFNSDTNAENDPLRSTGAIYNVNPPTRTDVARGPWQWNSLIIEAVGNRIKVTLNDVLVNDYADPKPRSLRGHIALQNHHTGSKVQFRNIRIKNVAPTVVPLTVPRRTAA